MTNEIDMTEDYYDSRDIISRYDVLVEMREDNMLDSWERDELELLEDVIRECDSIEDWKWGASLIADRYFVEYTEQLAEDIGEYDDAQRWPYNCIDWEEAARQLQFDYSYFTFINGYSYWVR